jgi:hypothetical protein
MTGLRAWLRRAAVPLVAVLALALSGGWLAVRGGQTGWRSAAYTAGPGAGMMGSAGLMGSAGMMGFGLAGDGRPVRDLGAARARAERFAAQLDPGLRVGEVMAFTNQYYAEIQTAAGAGVTEVLVDRGTGAVNPEPGPAMMWNTRYGMAVGAASGAASDAGLDAAQAAAAAQAWLRQAGRDVTVGAAEPFPGYYTLHTIRDGRIDGMLSVQATTGAVWYHGWHGRFLDMAEHA